MTGRSPTSEQKKSSDREASDRSERRRDNDQGNQRSSSVSPRNTQVIHQVGGLLVATADDGEKADDVKPKIQVFRLRHASPDSVFDTVAEIFADTPELRLAVDSRISSIIVRTDPTTLDEVANLVAELDIPAEAVGPTNDAKEFAVYAINELDPRMVLSTLQVMFSGYSDIRLDVDPETNRLLVYASPEAHKTIQAIIKQLTGPADGR